MGEILRLTRKINNANDLLDEIRKILGMIYNLQAQILDVQKEASAEPKTEKMLRPKELAAFLNVDAKTIWNWKKNGTLVPLKIGSREFYRQSAILAFMEEYDV